MENFPLFEKKIKRKNFTAHLSSVVFFFYRLFLLTKLLREKFLSSRIMGIDILFFFKFRKFRTQ